MKYRYMGREWAWRKGYAYRRYCRMMMRIVGQQKYSHYYHGSFGCPPIRYKESRGLYG